MPVVCPNHMNTWCNDSEQEGLAARPTPSWMLTNNAE